MGSERESAVLFAELIGAAELYASAGATAAHDAIARAVEKLGQAATARGAQLLKTTGSRLMLLAESADAAARAAVAMHEASRGLADGAAGGLGLGIGFHFGPVIREDGDVFGDTVNLAARLVEQAANGQILFAAETAHALSAPQRRTMRRLYSLPVKGRSEEVELCELEWRFDASRTFMPAVPAAPRDTKLTLLYRRTLHVLLAGAEPLTIGRGSDCGLVVSDAQASRRHCSILPRNDHFVLVDGSTNGTFVTVEGEEETRLEHAELVLRKRGWISIGGQRGATAATIEFRCD